MINQTKREQLQYLKTQLESERASFLSHWRDIGDFIAPRRPRFNVYDNNKGQKKNQNIIDSTASLSLRTLRSGMMSGVTSPARPWFRLTVSDAKLAETSEVKVWLDEVTRRMTTAFLRSNLYNVLPIVYGDMGSFGTSAMLMEEDFDNVVTFYPFPIGSYYISNNHKLHVDVFYREFRMTVRQLVQKFGRQDNGKIDWSKFSSHVKALYETNMLEQWINVSHVILPNDDYRPNSPLAKNKKYASVYFETGNDKYNDLKNDIFLRESGYEFFPVLCPRWEINGEDVYGTSCPGMDALGDVRQLQKGEQRSMQAIEKMVNPPLTGPGILQNTTTSLLAGDITYLDVREGQQGLRPIHEVNFRIMELEQKQQQVRQRIQRAFYEDLFLMLAASDRRQITAREIEERHEEKLLALGPVLEQLNQDLLDPLIDNTFTLMMRQGLIPPAPKSLQGRELKVEYISIMAQAQKTLGISSVEKFTGFVAQVAQVDQSVLQKVDADQLIDVYSDLVSLPAGIVRSDEDVQSIRSEQAKAQAQMQQAQMMQQQAIAAKNLSQTKLEGDSALDSLLDQARSGRLTQTEV